MPDIGDQPIEPRYNKMMNDLARSIDRFFNGNLTGEARKTGFVLLTFDFGSKGRCNYISNTERVDVVHLLEEQLKRFKGEFQEGTGTKQ